MDILAIVLMVMAGRKKAYPYFVCGALCLLYSILYTLVIKPPAGLLDTASYEMIRICEKVLPAILFFFVMLLSGKKNHLGKRNYVPCVVCGVICAVRIARFCWVRYYINLILNAGASAFELTELGILATNINTIVMSFLFFLLSIALIWHLRKYHCTMKCVA